MEYWCHWAINRKYETFVCSRVFRTDKADELELTMPLKHHQFSKILKVNFSLSNAISFLILGSRVRTTLVNHKTLLTCIVDHIDISSGPSDDNKRITNVWNFNKICLMLLKLQYAIYQNFIAAPNVSYSPVISSTKYWLTLLPNDDSQK